MLRANDVVMGMRQVYIHLFVSYLPLLFRVSKTILLSSRNMVCANKAGLIGLLTFAAAANAFPGQTFFKARSSLESSVG